MNHGDSGIQILHSFEELLMYKLLFVVLSAAFAAMGYLLLTSNANVSLVMQVAVVSNMFNVSLMSACFAIGLGSERSRPWVTKVLKMGLVVILLCFMVMFGEMAIHYYKAGRHTVTDILVIFMCGGWSLLCLTGCMLFLWNWRKM